MTLGRHESEAHRRPSRPVLSRRSLLAAGAGAVVAQLASAGPAFATGTGRVPVSFAWMDGYQDPATPARLNKVGVLKAGYAAARNVLVLVPGTSAGSAYFLPLARDIVAHTRGRWQVWAVERRENQLEDHSMLDQAKLGKASHQEVFDHYLGWLVDPAITEHYQPVADATVPYARGWGMKVTVGDLHRVVRAAGRHGRRVVLGGH
ncbi:hypothetical protein ACFQVC_28805 [Streptomyces monticola]|uniref:Alpha/beta hydrolase n=1 Tax=Streptomyces monticola TaxID=2666263 RepID=A0ABW2JRJ0_9ACTN